MLAVSKSGKRATASAFACVCGQKTIEIAGLRLTQPQKGYRFGIRLCVWPKNNCCQSSLENEKYAQNSLQSCHD